MYDSALALLACPHCRGDLALSAETRDPDDGEILEGALGCVSCGKSFPVTNGIPRFVTEDSGYNPTWNYKWTKIDRGRGLNYKILDRSDPAFETHNVFDCNGYEGRAHECATGRSVLDIGCGVGQYSVEILRRYDPAHVTAVDLTEGVDIFRKILRERYPEYKQKVHMVQASVFALPFRPGTFEYVFSFGVLHHTGRTRDAIRAAADMAAEGGHLNFWIYASSIVPISVREPGRPRPLRELIFAMYYMWIEGTWIRLFRNMSPAAAARIIRPFASDFWTWFNRIPFLKYIGMIVFPTIQHPDREYRFLNLFDGYCNHWDDTWSEHEIFPTLRECGIAIKGISPWRLGFWGVKQSGFYDTE